MNLADIELKHAKYAFYDLNLDSKTVAEGLHKELKPLLATNLLVVAHLAIARELSRKGYNITLLATNEDMRDYLQKNSIELKTIFSDIRTISSDGKFDAIVCLGDTFSHMIENKDVYFALQGFHKTLKYGGLILLENISASKLLNDNGANTITKVENGDLKIKRTSSLTPVSNMPPISVWKSSYEVIHNGKKGVYEEYARIRGYEEKEWEKFITGAQFSIIKILGTNSGFVTVARK